jgi:hypothetical protein
MNAINAARRMRIAALENAEAQKVTVVKAAEAEAEVRGEHQEDRFLCHLFTLGVILRLHSLG